MSSTEWVLLARLVRPQGRKGEIIADIFTDFPERFRERPRVFLRPSKATESTREALIEKHWLHQGRVVLKFHGIDSINDAETLRGMDVVVPPEERVPLKDDAVYIGDLIGCRIFDEPTAQDVGEIIDVERGLGDAPDLFVVRPALVPQVQSAEPVPSEAKRGRKKKTPRSEPLLVPFAKAYLVTIDLPAKRITMRLPEGLTDLNTAFASESAPEQED
jgi:16S rRNA processing protein RimM